MTTNSSQQSGQGSAKIYQFPVGGRQAIGNRRAEFKPVTEIDQPRVAPQTFGGAWYHEAAIQDARRAGEH
jgi:hypothetical protein